MSNSSRSQLSAMLCSSFLLAIAVGLQELPTASGSVPRHCSTWLSSCHKYRERCTSNALPVLDVWESCQAVTNYGNGSETNNLKSGVYWLRKEGNFTIVQSFCDTETDGGGWLVIMRRVDGTTSFNENFEAYENGFGDPEKSFWYGLKTLHELTKRDDWEVRIEVTLSNGTKLFAHYNSFSVKGQDENYRLTIENYSSNRSTAEDNLSGYSGEMFSTQDYGSHRGCGQDHLAGWWYPESCIAIGNKGPIMTAPYGIIYTRWTIGDTRHQVDKYEMKMRKR